MAKVNTNIGSSVEESLMNGYHTRPKTLQATFTWAVQGLLLTGISLLSLPLHAGMITQTQSFEVSMAETSSDELIFLKDTQSVWFEPFDASLGILEDVMLTLNGSLSGTIMASREDIEGETFSVASSRSFSSHTVSVFDQVTYLDPEYGGFVRCQSDDESVPGTDACFNIEALSTETFTNLQLAWDDLRDFQGSDPWSVEIDSRLTASWFIPPPAGTFGSTRDLAGDITVKYQFATLDSGPIPTPVPVPEPSSLPLLLSALAGLVLSRRLHWASRL